MAIPDYETVMLPLLKFSNDKKEHHIREAIEVLGEDFDLSEQERKQLLPSGNKRIFDDRVGWAGTYLKKCNVLESTRRGCFRITKRGLAVLKQNPKKIDCKFLAQFPEFHEFKKRRVKKKPGNKKTDIDSQTPEEVLETAYEEVNESLAEELLNTVKNSSPSFFEILVIDLLVKMGYGGSRKDAGEAIGKSGDEGIDGLINEDPLGLETIYIQAKRWENVVSRPEVQKFAGALQGKRAKKGIFITTSRFSRDAEDYASRIDNKIVLIDGEKLTQLMIEHNVGVSMEASYEVKKIDSDYFDK